MVLTSETIETIRKGVRDREAMRDPERLRGLNRIDIEVSEGLAYRATRPGEEGAVMTVDEPPERGGTGTGASPLAHFLTGAGSCLLNQFIRVSIAEGYDLTFTKLNVRAEFRRDVGGGFEHLMQDVFADGTLADEEMGRLAERAEAFCYVHNTLSKAIKITTVVHLNGREVVRRVSEP